MKRVAFALIIFLLFPILPTSAAETLTITNTGAPAVIFYPSEFDKLVMDFTVARADGAADVLNALTLQNDGTAWGWDISKVVVWADAGAVGFQGMDIDEKLGEAIRYETGGYWYLQALQKTVPAAGLRIFVSIETGTKSVITSNRSLQFKVSALTDSGTVGRFDIGDTGVFLAGTTGVAAGIVNSNTQTIWVSNYDVSGPKTAVTAPAAGTTLATATYKITGTARDQGGSTPATVQIQINFGLTAGSWVDVVNTGANFSTWEYNWTSITDGTYTIKTQGVDWLGNKETVGEGTTVTVDQAAAITVSPSLSTVTLTPATVPADGVAQVIVHVTIKNSLGNLLSGKTATLVSSRSADTVTAVRDTTLADGIATFIVKSTSSGDATLKAMVGAVEISQQPIATFTSTNINAGDLIKGSGSTTTYYYGTNGLKYIFPDAATYASWYTGFSGVKTVSDAELTAISTTGNVTVRPGKLIQVVSMDTPWQVMDPKVYAVSKGGVVHWLKTAEVAVAIFGANWESQIVAVPESFFTSYTSGGDISVAADYNLAAEQAVGSIDADKRAEVTE